MALINCSDCRRQISDCVPACSHCGVPTHVSGRNAQCDSGGNAMAVRMRRCSWVLAAALSLCSASVAAKSTLQVPFEAVKTYAVPVSGLSIAEIGKALQWSALGDGWVISDAGDDSFVAATTVRGRHYVKVRFTYTTSEIRIEYLDSRDLDYGLCRIVTRGEIVRELAETCIHGNYYGWLDHIVSRFEVSVQQLRFLGALP